MIKTDNPFQSWNKKVYISSEINRLRLAKSDSINMLLFQSKTEQCVFRKLHDRPHYLGIYNSQNSVRIP